MLSLNEHYRYYLYPAYVSMNRGIESLSELLNARKDCHALSGDVFLFFGKKRDTVKILRWDTDGFIFYQKRLEQGSFELPRFQPEKGLKELSWETFFMIMRGIPLKTPPARKRFRLPI